MWGIPVPSRVPVSGSGWGWVIRSGSGVPADALGNLGDRYFDTAAQRWYLKRWVGNFAGIDYINGPSLGSGDGVVDLTMLVYYDGNSTNQRLIGNTVNASGFRMGMWSGKLHPLIGGVGSIGYAEGDVGTTLSVGWHKIRGYYRAGGVDCYVDGSLVGSLAAASAPGANLAGSRTVAIGDFGVDSTMSFKAANVSISAGGATKGQWSISEGAGATIVDSSGAGNNGVLSDNSPATFWLQTWVPMDLL